MSLKKSFVNVVCALILCAVALTQFVACGDNGANDSNGDNGNNGGDTPVINEIEIESVLEQNSAYANLDLQTAIEEAILQRVASQFDVTTSNVELLDMQRKNNLTIVAKVSESKIVTAYFQNNAFAAYEGADKKDLVLQKAGYTAKQKIEQTKKDEANAKITQAVNEVAATIEQIGNADFDKTNVILDGFSDEKYIPESLKSACDFAFLGKVREDGTVIAITLANGTLKDNVLSVEGKEDLTNEQILTTVASGNGFSTTTRTIDASKTYEMPKLEEKPIEMITVGEIFDQNFTNVDFAADIESAFQNIYVDNFGQQRKCSTFFYTQNDIQICVYVNVNSNGRDTLYKLSFESSLNLNELSINAKNSVLSAIGLDEHRKVLRNESNDVIRIIENAINSTKDYIKSLLNKNVDRESVFVNATKDSVDKAAFGKKLCPDKDVIATYVGSLGGKQLNDTFGTGYVRGFNIAVVYKENNQVKIYTVRIIVPHYTNDNNEDSYNRFLLKTAYYFVDEVTETVNNPVLAEGIGDNQD